MFREGMWGVKPPPIPEGPLGELKKTIGHPEVVGAMRNAQELYKKHEALLARQTELTHRMASDAEDENISSETKALLLEFADLSARQKEITHELAVAGEGGVLDKVKRSAKIMGWKDFEERLGKTQEQLRPIITELVAGDKGDIAEWKSLETELVQLEDEIVEAEKIVVKTLEKRDATFQESQAKARAREVQEDEDSSAYSIDKLKDRAA